MRLTVNIRNATDGQIELQVLELPKLTLVVERMGDIRRAVREAAAAETGQPEGEFEVEVLY